MTMLVWRSLLFVPANNEKHVAKAHTRGADGIILDLEDSVALDQKAVARKGLSATVTALADRSCDVLVRVNAGSLDDDINVACVRSVLALVIPKVSDAKAVQQAAGLLDRYEAERDLKIGAIRLIAQIEDVHALQNLDAIAKASPRMLGMSLGSEDFSASAGMLPSNETLYGPNQQVVFACRRAAILPFGFPASITLVREMEALIVAAEQAANMGMVGAFCIHPDQVAVLNDALTPTADAVANATALLQQYSAAKESGMAVFSFNGKMVDLPVVLQARTLVARSHAIASKVN
jgi:citrate lyase subunit beta/citryl-CoA lyase